MPVIVVGLLLYVGCGSPSSPPTPQVRVYSGAGYPVVADFNQDGKADVFTAPTFGDSKGTMNLGGGNGDFQAATSVPLPNGFYVTAVADFNGDGKPDLLATNCAPGIVCGSTPLKVFLGNGDGTFQTTSVSTAGTLLHLVAADLNGDAKADVVGILNGTLIVYLSNGDGTFTTSASYNFSGFGALALGDFNGDGKIDVVIGTDGDFLSEGQTVVFLGNGDGTFQPAKVSPGAYSTGSIVVADFNGDGKSDLAMSGCGLIAGCDEWSMLGNGDGTFQGLQFFGPTTDPLDGTSALGGVDFNGDGKADLVVQGTPFWDTADIYLGNGDGTFTKTNSYTVGSSVGSSQQLSFGIAIADFNGDGKPDIAVANTVLLGNGDGTFRGPN